MCQYCLHVAKFSLRLENGELVDVCRKHYLDIVQMLRESDDVELSETNLEPEEVL